MSIRVLFWAELFWPYIGGAEIFAAELMHALGPRGFEFAVITAHDYLDLPDDDAYRGVPVHRFPFHSALTPEGFEDLLSMRRRATECARRFAPDVIHVNGVGASAFFCLHAARAAKAPVLLRLNREIRRKDTSDSVMGRVLAAAAWVVAVSSPVLEQARRLAPEVATRSSVVHSGVDVPRRPPDRGIVEPPTVLCVGRLVRDKGFDLALDALPAILRRVPAARMRIAGDGPESAALRRQADALGIMEHVDFTGWIPPDEVSTLISAATIVVMPSRTEGLPMTALQASAMGRPIVASSVGGLSGIVRHGETGLLVDLEPAAIAAAVARLLEDPDEAARLGRAAWERAGALFGIEQCADAYADLYRRLSSAA